MRAVFGVVLVLLAPACAGGGGAGPDASAQLTTYCSTALRLETVGEPDPGQPLQEFVGARVLPLVSDLAATAPAAVSEDVRALRDLVRGVASTGDPSVFASPEFQQRNARMHAFELGSCGWARTDAEAVDGRFSGVPAELDAGPRSFELTNAGTTPHQLAIVLKETGGPRYITSAIADPAGHGYAVADLAPGDYTAVCLLTTGMATDFTVR